MLLCFGPLYSDLISPETLFYFSGPCITLMVLLGSEVPGLCAKGLGLLGLGFRILGLFVKGLGFRI